jgi:cytidine deaminase
MKEINFSFGYTEFNSIEELQTLEQKLLTAAREVTSRSYAPYSHFSVGAAALLYNGVQVLGTNQENASYPVGICAERTLLAAAATQYPGVPIEMMAISYLNLNKPNSSEHAISPCGMCRQALNEFEQRTSRPIKLILSGMTGEVIIINTAAHLLPLAFTGKELLK